MDQNQLQPLKFHGRETAKWCAVAAVSALMTGCVIPYHFITRTGAVGTIVDSQTKKPVVGAAVSMKGDTSTASTKSDKNGQFSLPAERSWGIYIIPEELWPQPDLLTVERKGYVKYRREIRIFPTGRCADSIENVGTIPLRRVTY